ncbi:MAG: peptide chain release factor N(5)-glutamine methyltransferase [Prolixibacteraceae bacterium]|nr:peptide chain release factor N(5)-glutamine methyltransferase [Prolixibacteraceae bacterium]
MQATIQYIKNELRSIYPESEIQGFIKIVLEWATGWNYTVQHLNRQVKLDETVRQKIYSVVKRLKDNEPIQYILGETEFFGLNIKVTPSVLIPRPETEELVYWIIEKNKKQRPKILDIGTGSGCIALSLKSNLGDAEVEGVDFSEPALEIAKENASLNQLNVSFFKADILLWEKFNWHNYDIIVSNPPYIRESEKLMMQKNVLDYEPESALFVSDNDPLVFYSRIVAFAQQKLFKGGQLFFEINENMDREMYDLLSSFGFRNINLKCDINEKKRMIYCER